MFSDFTISKTKDINLYSFEKLQYNSFGMCFIPHLLNSDGINIVLENINLISEKHINKYATFEENSNEIKVIPYLDKDSDFFFDFVRNSLFKDLSFFLLNKKVTPLFAEFFCKTKRVGSYSPPHQDQIFYDKHFQEEDAISFWIALDDSFPENGGLSYSLNYNSSLHPHKKSMEKGFSLELENASKEEFFPIPVKKGDCIIHNSLIAHMSAENKSNFKRRALVVNYRTSSYRDKFIR